MNIIIFQHGNFAEDYRRLMSGGAEVYRDQRRSVAFVADLAQAGTVMNVVLGQADYDVELAPGLHATALPHRALTAARVRALLDRTRPDAIILRTPHLGVLREAARRGIPVLPCLADIFGRPQTWRGRVRQWQLARALKTPVVPCVANHSLNASLSVARHLRYPASHVVPWDWSRIPVQKTAKAAPGKTDVLRAFYAGALTEEKGVGDCLTALADVRARGVGLQFSFAGPGDLEHWHARAQASGVAEAASFLGGPAQRTRPRGDAPARRRRGALAPHLSRRPAERDL